jgi:hypothetical protein
MTNITKTVKSASLRTAVLAVAAIGLAACNMATGDNYPGIGSRVANFENITTVREYRQCNNDAMVVDQSARSENAPARYIKSAQLIAKCEAGLGERASLVSVEERMRNYALGVQNHFKGGDVVQARTNLEKFKSAFADKDLYYADGSSFVDTMEILLGLRDYTALGEFSVANVNSVVKSELRRVRYWKTN